MFHPGKILEVHREKGNTQATIEMWDENLFTFHVANNIADKIKRNDIVLVDYRPVSDKLAIPRQTITKIFKNSGIWKTYKTYFKKKKSEVLKAKKQKIKFNPVQNRSSFAG